MCDIVVPFHEQDTVLINETKPQSLSFLLLPQDGETAFIWESEKGYGNVVEKLLAARADPNKQNEVRNMVARVMLIHMPNACSNKVLHLFLGQ